MEAALGERSVCAEVPCDLRPDEAVRIARTLGAPLASFVTLGRAAGGTGFRLAPEPGAPVCGLTLRKDGPSGSAACVFALPLHGARTACGLGALAPEACGGPRGVHLDPSEGASRAAAAAARWHEALDAGPYRMPEEVLFGHLLDTFADLWPSPRSAR